MKNVILICCTTLLLAACAGPKVKNVQRLADSADAPYSNVLVVSLFDSFDLRRELELGIVEELESRGIEASASTSLIDVKTPLNRDSILAAVAESGSDAVLVTQMVNLETSSELKDRRPESTYNVRPTYYFNVWNVEMTEYSEPQGLEIKRTFTMATQVYSVHSQEPVWAIEKESDLTRTIDQQFRGTSIAAEAKAIGSAMARDGLLAR